MSGQYGEISGVVTVEDSPVERDLIAISYDKQSVDDGAGGTVQRRLVVGETRSATDGTYTLQTPGFVDEVVVLALDNYGETWRPNVEYSVGQRVRPTKGNETGYGYDITVAGNSGPTEPAWWLPAGGSDTGEIGGATAQARPLWWSVAHAPVLPTALGDQPWTLDLATPALLVDCGDQANITMASGTAVSAVVDQSENAFVAGQASASWQPSLVEGFSGGRTAILSDSGDALTLGNVLDDILAGATPQYTMVFLFRYSGPGRANIIAKLGDGSHGQNNRQFFVEVTDAGKLRHLIYNSTGTGGSARGVDSSFAVGSGIRIAAITFDASTTGNNGLDRVQMWIDGEKDTPVLGYSSGTLVSTFPTTPAHLSLLAAYGTSGPPAYGGNIELGLAGIFPGVASDELIDRIIGRIAWDWDLVDNLPADHTYKNLSPTL